MQFTPWDNPMGTNEFEFIECAAPNPVETGTLFARMGFITIARHRHKQVTLLSPRQVRLHPQRGSGFLRPALRATRAEHPQRIRAIAFRVRDSKVACEQVASLGARLYAGVSARAAQHLGDQGRGGFADVLRRPVAR